MTDVAQIKPIRWQFALIGFEYQLYTLISTSLHLSEMRLVDFAILYVSRHALRVKA